MELFNQPTLCNILKGLYDLRMPELRSAVIAWWDFKKQKEDINEKKVLYLSNIRVKARKY